MQEMQNQLEMLPGFLRDRILPYVKAGNVIREIKCRIHSPVFIYTQQGEVMLGEKQGPYRLGEGEMESLLTCLCEHSFYAYEDELRQGFFTLEGGHRVGVAGKVILDGQDMIRQMKHIRFVTIRMAQQIKGVAKGVLPYVYGESGVRSTLIISPPGCGKTTLLRDLIRQLSNGTEYGSGMNVGVVDERMELAGCFMGVPQNDVGIRTDVLQGCPKALGVIQLLRSMSPAVIAVDEIGSSEDGRALQVAASSGVAILATLHGASIQDYQQKEFLKGVIAQTIFSRFILLGKQNHQYIIKEILGQHYEQLT